jgi:hypothetical protein
LRSRVGRLPVRECCSTVPELCPRRSTSGQFQPMPHTIKGTRRSRHLIECSQVASQSREVSIDEKRPGMALLNLHPPFKSGRRLQNPQQIRESCTDRACSESRFCSQIAGDATGNTKEIRQSRRGGGGFQNLLPSAVLYRGQVGDDDAITLFAASAFANMFCSLRGAAKPSTSTTRCRRGAGRCDRTGPRRANRLVSAPRRPAARRRAPVRARLFRPTARLTVAPDRSRCLPT